MTKLKQREVATTLRANRISLRRTDAGDLRVAPMGLSRERMEALAYYTNDIADALHTGLAMARARNGGDLIR